jgi:indole-3-glycerol phosphate synthase
MLLMVAALPDGSLAELLGLATDLGLTTLVEAHTAEELHRAREIGATLIGINARDFRTLEVDRSVFKVLAADIPAGAVRVAESGVAGPEDVAEYHSWGERGPGGGGVGALRPPPRSGTRLSARRRHPG